MLTTSPRLADTMSDTHPPTQPGINPRQAFDELLRRKVEAIRADHPSPTSGAGVDYALTADEDAGLMDAQCRTFADAVDRTGTGVAYSDAVVITGTGGVVVVHVRDYEATPIYWQACAGEVDLIIDGADVMHALST